MATQEACDACSRCAPVGAPGEVAEWLKASVLKTECGETRTWVRIPLSPPIFSYQQCAGTAPIDRRWERYLPWCAHGGRALGEVAERLKALAC